MALRVIRPGDRIEKKRAPRSGGGKQANRNVRRRMLVLMAICLLVGFLPVSAQLYKLMIVDHDQYEETAKEWTKKFATKEETPDEQLVGVSLMVYGIGL